MWEFILHRVFGVGAEGGTQVRLGAGVVHLTTGAFIAFVVGVGGVCWALSKDPYLALSVVVVMALFGTVFLLGTWWFADKHPDQAALGGSSWLKLRELQIGEAKVIEGRVDAPPLPPSTDPTRNLPNDSVKSIGSGRTD